MKKIIAGLALAAATTCLMADGAALFKPCAGCHGASGEKAALGKSQIIKGWDAAKVSKALHGYKDGSYGGAMKGVMKGQVASLDDAKIGELSKYIAGLK
jgi:cytochrome c553